MYKGTVCVCVVGSKEFAQRVLAASGLNGLVSSLSEEIAKCKLIVKSNTGEGGEFSAASLVGIEFDGYEKRKYEEQTVLVAGNGTKYQAATTLSELSAAVVRERISNSFFEQMVVDNAIDKAASGGHDIAVISGLNRTNDLGYFMSLGVPVICDDTWLPSPDFKPVGITVSLGDTPYGENGEAAIDLAGQYMRSFVR